MKYFDWSEEKNKILMQDRNVSFEMVIVCIQGGGIVDKVRHPNQNRYAHQHIYIINIDDYIYAVPFVEDDKKIFLKTIIPSRKLTRQYLNK